MPAIKGKEVIIITATIVLLTLVICIGTYLIIGGSKDHISERVIISKILPDCTELRTVSAFVWVIDSNGNEFIQNSFHRFRVYPDQVDKSKREVMREAQDELDRISAIKAQCKKEGKL